MADFCRKVRVRAIIPYAGKYLFVQHNHDATFWALPGGGLEDGETLEQGITRELVEELGVKPALGKILYVQQLFLPDNRESLEFFFLVTNGGEYQSIDLHATTHGALELARAEFIDPAVEVSTTRVMPQFLTELSADMATHNWPKLYVRQTTAV